MKKTHRCQLEDVQNAGASAGIRVSAFLPLVAGHARDEIVLCPPFVSIPAVVEATRGSKVAVGGQDMFWETEGAYTGEVCAPMLHAVGCSHVIIGHSERRQYFGETDDTVNHNFAPHWWLD